VLSTGLAVSGVAAFWQQAITGVILIVAVFLDKVQRDGWSSLGFGRGITARRKAAAARAAAGREPE
jgi:ribose/xylose/arabinose/galactoside ABC-type transport system permease subunit